MGGDALQLERQPYIWRRTGHVSDISGSPPTAQGLEEGDQHLPMLS